MVYKVNPWLAEEPLVPEASVSQSWHDPDRFMAWNIASPELEFIMWIQDEVAQLTTERGFITVLETGLGGGYVTRRVIKTLGDTPFKYIAFEDMHELVNFVPLTAPICVVQGTPWARHYQMADVVILDSAPKYRMDEIVNVAKYGKEGAHVFIHDAGEQKGLLNDMAKQIKKVGLENEDAEWYQNPRGGFHTIIRRKE